MPRRAPWVDVEPDQREIERLEAKSRRGRWLLWPSYAALWLLFRVVGRYRISGLEDVRRRFREVAAEPGPLLVCANHLSYIDSILIMWALGSPRWYARHYSHLSWNLPAEDVFGKKKVFRAVAAISKCIFVDRRGSNRHKDGVLHLCRNLLAKGEVVTIFPEGGRSRSGRFETDRLTSGAGKLVAGLGGCNVLCVYLRSDRQDSYANYPPRGSNFYVDMAVLRINADAAATHSYREISATIGERIARMESQYFAQAPAVSADK